MVRKAEDSEGFNVTFQIRVTQSMKNAIDRFAGLEGMKSSAWVRKAIQFAIDNMENGTPASSGNAVSKKELLSLIENDSEVADALFKATAEKANLFRIRDTLESYYLESRKTFSRADDSADGRLLDLIWNLLDSFPVAEVDDCVSHYYGSELSGTFVWDQVKWGVEGSPADRCGIDDFFCMEYEAGDASRGLYFWNGMEAPDLKSLYEGFNEESVSIFHAKFILDGDVPLDQNTADYLVNLIRKLAAKTFETSLGEVRSFRSTEWYAVNCSNVNRSFKYIPESFSAEWISSDMRNGRYRDLAEEDVRKILNEGEDETLQLIFTIWDSDESVIVDEDGFWQDEDAGASSALPEDLGETDNDLHSGQ